MADVTQGDIWLLGIQILLYSIAAVFMLRRWHSVFWGMRQGRWALGLAGLALISAIWSVNPSFTMRRALAVLATTAFGVYFGTSFERRDQLRLLCRACGLLAVLSALAALLFPGYGVDHAYRDGEWIGVFANNNILGRVMVLGCIAFLFSSSRNRRHAVRNYCWAAFCLAVGWMSGSRTALMAFVAVLFASIIYRLVARRRATEAIPGLIVCGIGGLLLAALIWRESGQVLALIGRDATLTGRTYLWDAVLLAIWKRPWLGYGFNAFWAGISGPSLSVAVQARWVASHAHNGFLDLWLNVGIAGLLLFVIGFGARMRRAVMECRPGIAESYWPVLFLTLLFVYNITESSILMVNGLFWMLYAALLASGSMWTWQQQLSRSLRTSSSSVFLNG